MAKLELFYPVRPLRINQAFGISNPSYNRFGFSKHNGIDYATGAGQICYAMCDGVIIDVGTNNGAGNFVTLKTHLPVEAEGRTGYVALMYMHGERHLVRKNQTVKVGDPLMVCDNTGFSTGHHLHISAFFISSFGTKEHYGEAVSDWCFDFSKYYAPFFAEDAQKVFAIYYQIIGLLRAYLNK